MFAAVLPNSYYKLSFFNLRYYFKILAVRIHGPLSIFGFFIILNLCSQLISGIVLSFSYIPEPMLAPIVRDEENNEDLYTDDFFWLHERGVDCLFIFCYLHLFRKLYLQAFYLEQEFAWKSGVFAFIIFQVVTFFGLVLCCTHLSEITLNIACNIMHTFFGFKGKPYWWLFTDNTLNCDTLLRLAYAHYIAGFFFFFLGIYHAIDMHYDWKNFFSFAGDDITLVWFDEALVSELVIFSRFLLYIFIISTYLYHEPETLTYEIFMWGDVGHITDIRFYQVAPHWYFRPFMAWLTACPFHYTGILGLILFFALLYFQPNLANVTETPNTLILQKWWKVVFTETQKASPDHLWAYQIWFAVFCMAMLYTTSFLPAGRYFNRVFGNTGLLISYIIIFYYLSFYRAKFFIDVRYVGWYVWKIVFVGRDGWDREFYTHTNISPTHKGFYPHQE